jgi:flagellar motility protein MotE (MotC chaperone)
VHRFQLSRLGSELASDDSESDRLFGSSSICFVGPVLAPRLFGQWLAQNINQQSASFASDEFDFDCDRRGSFFMQLKMWILSGTAIVLWLAPLTVLDKKVGWHKSIQGLSLGAAIACAVSAGNIARKLSEEEEIEAIKTRAITADVVDEIAVSAYISQQQRQQEAEQILNPVEALERALALPDAEVERSEPIAQNQLAEPEQNSSENTEAERAERTLQLKAKGWGKAKIILEIWGVTKGGSPKYKAAEAEYAKILESSG